MACRQALCRWSIAHECDSNERALQQPEWRSLAAVQRCIGPSVRAASGEHPLRRTHLPNRTGRLPRERMRSGIHHSGGRGYEVARGHYLIVSDEELDAIEIASTHTVEIDSFVPPASSRRDQRKSPAKRRAGPAFGYAGDGLPSRCIRRYRLPSRCTRKKFHARPEQGNGPAADGASFSLTLKFIGVRKEPLFPSGTKTIRGLGNRSARFHHPHPSTVCVPRAFPGSHLCCGRPDCVADDAVICEPVSAANSLLTGKLTGNFAESGPQSRFSSPIDSRFQWLTDEFPM
jgi:hypothetical protein